MTYLEQLAHHIRGVLVADNIEDAHREARTALRLIKDRQEGEKALAMIGGRK